MRLRLFTRIAKVQLADADMVVRKVVVVAGVTVRFTIPQLKQRLG